MAPNTAPQKSRYNPSLNFMCVAWGKNGTVLPLMLLGEQLKYYRTGFIINLITFGVSEAGEVCGVCAFPDLYRGSTYVCIIYSSSTYVFWFTYVLLLLNNIEGNILYYLRRWFTNVLAGRCQWVCKQEHMFGNCGHPSCPYATTHIHLHPRNYYNDIYFVDYEYTFNNKSKDLKEGK